MVEVVIRHDHVVLDACCIITIASTGEFERIIQALPAQCVVASYVLNNEVLSYIDIEKREIPIELGDLIKMGLIQDIGIDYSQEDEANYVVAFEAQNLDSGEAESASIAINRGWAIATDDKRAINVISQASSRTQILTTPELVKYWVDNIGVSEDELRQVIRSIRRYIPPNNHPLYAWWQQYL